MGRSPEDGPPPAGSGLFKTDPGKRMKRHEGLTSETDRFGQLQSERAREQARPGRAADIGNDDRATARRDQAVMSLRWNSSAKGEWKGRCLQNGGSGRLSLSS